MVDWIQIDKNSGNSGTTVITVTAATYSELVQRTTSLTVNTVNTSLSGSVAITQEARDVVTVMVSPTTISAPVCGGTYSFNIISNGDWTITYPEWVSLSQSAGTGNATITVVLGNNQTVEDLLGNIVVSTIDNSATVQVSQEGLYAYISVSPTRLVYVIDGGTDTITITSNAPWTASTNVGWLTLSSSAGTGNGSITVTCSATSEDRNAVITFSTKDESAITTILQYNKVPYLVLNESAMTFDGNGGVQNLGVSSNVDWEIETVSAGPSVIIIARENGTLSIKNAAAYNGSTTFTYSINGSNLSTGSSVSVNTNDIIVITQIENGTRTVSPNIDSTFNYDVIGNFKDVCNNFGTVRELFKNSKTKIIDASGLILDSTDTMLSGMCSGCINLTKAPVLPATNLVYESYKNMFQGCTSLTTAPELPATTLAAWCYESMFAGCTSLTGVPSNYLPATEAVYACYKNMFSGCTSLTTAPELPATTVGYDGYNGMFQGCTSLTTAPELPATSLAHQCYNNMFVGCTSLTTAPSILPATVLPDYYCYAGMFYGCTSLTTAPELPATTLAQYCYYKMFKGCSNLNYIKCLATDRSANSCTSDWVDGVQTTSGTFVKAAGASWPTNASGIPNNWTIIDN